MSDLKIHLENVFKTGLPLNQQTRHKFNKFSLAHTL